MAATGVCSTVEDRLPESLNKGLDKPAVLQVVLDAYRTGYATLADDWRNLDTKAQGTVTIAGIFLAGVFGFVKTLSERKTVVVGSLKAIPDLCIPLVNYCASRATVENVLLAIGVVGLFIAVLLAVLALRVRFIPAPFGDQVDKMAKDVICLLDTEPTRDTKTEFLNQQTVAWREALDGIVVAYTQKATKLAWAQGALVGGATIVTILTLIEVLNA